MKLYVSVHLYSVGFHYNENKCIFIFKEIYNKNIGE